MIQQGLIVQRARFGRGSGGGRGNASLITLPFRPRETSLACSAYIRTNSLGGAVAAPVPKPHCFRFYHCPPLICLSCAFQRWACKRRKQCTMQVTLLLKSARPPFLRAAPGRGGARRKLISPARPRRRCVPRSPSVWWSASGSHSANKRLEGVRLWGALNAKCTIPRET